MIANFVRKVKEVWGAIYPVLFYSLAVIACMIGVETGFSLMTEPDDFSFYSGLVLIVLIVALIIRVIKKHLK